MERREERREKRGERSDRVAVRPLHCQKTDGKFEIEN